jgi:hypothetical protein
MEVVVHGSNRVVGLLTIECGTIVIFEAVEVVSGCDQPGLPLTARKTIKRADRMSGMDRYSVRLIGKTGESSQGVFIVDEDEDTDQCRLTFQYPGGEITVEALDYFEAMCQIRTNLETKGWRPVCFGSAQNVYPSNMARDMGRGLKAYKMEIGRRATTADLVRIFDAASDLQPVSVEEQRQFYEQWLLSLGINIKALLG